MVRTMYDGAINSNVSIYYLNFLGRAGIDFWMKILGFFYSRYDTYTAIFRSIACSGGDQALE